jgi:NAD(P)-dependent dehydrogenase (short-subunit alcohol dehydrogenase family)
MSSPLAGLHCLVAGATRGAGRGIAVGLGEAGATVVCVGRSTRERPGTRPETVDETAEQVTAAGGRGLAFRCDLTDEADAAALAARLRDQLGGLDVLVNDVWGADHLTEFGVPPWEMSVENARLAWESAVFTHLVSTRHFGALLVGRRRPLLVEITDGDTFGYRGAFAYDLLKMSTIRLAWSLDRELAAIGGTAVAVTPGYLRSEEMLERYGVTEANWRDGTAADPHFIASETPRFVGRAVAALAGDPDLRGKGGRVFSSWTLAREYGFTDLDGSRPDWGAYWARTFPRAYAVADREAYAAWAPGPVEAMEP